jgi:hypothetical protein
MAGPIGQCDAPNCGGELVALIRGVGLCDGHFHSVAACAAEQDTEPGALSRSVILALLQREFGPPRSDQRLSAPALQPRQAATRPGFYWVHDEAGWTVIQVTQPGAYLRLGYAEELSLEDHRFARMLPVRQPQGFPWDPLARR